MSQPTTQARTDAATHTLGAPGATITYHVRKNDSSTEPVLMLIGSPMGGSGFASLAKRFTDRTVVTYDPRGVEGSAKEDDLSESTPDQHADDIHRVIQAVGGGPVDLFASSGGAVNALALVAKHPGDVRTLVAHEPPLARILPDREVATAATRDIRETYLRDGMGAAMAKFIALVSFKGELPTDFLQQPPPDPAMFGLPAEDDGSRNDPLIGQNVLTTTDYEPDFDALRSAKTRIVIGAGVDSQGELAHRAALSVAERSGRELVMFSGGHSGFLGGEYGQMGKPDEFAAKLREVLSATR